MKKYIGIIIVIAGIILDQISKSFAMNIKESIEIIPNFLNFTYVQNTGIAFGIAKGANNIFILIVTLLILFIIGIIYYSYKKEGRIEIGFYLILSGAFGNLLDRVFKGFVVDFIDTPFIATFNIADSLICIGVAIAFINEFINTIRLNSLKSK